MIKFWKDILFEEAGDSDGGGGGGGNSGGAGDKKDPPASDSSDEDDESNGDDSDDSSEEDELSEDELKNAKGLFKLLKDPSTRDITLRTMAEKAGVLDKNLPSTKVEEKKAIRDVSDVLKDSLGPEYYALFGDKLSKGLKELFAQEREESGKATESIRLQAVESETDRAFEKLDRETHGESKKFRQQMTALADKILPAEGVSTYDYLNILYNVASGNKKAAGANKQMADKINRNRSDVADRTHQLSTGGGKNNQQPAPPKGLKNIVQQAIDSLAGGGKK